MLLAFFTLVNSVQAQSDPFTDLAAPTGIGNFQNLNSASCSLSAGNRISCSIPSGSTNNHGASLQPTIPDPVYGVAIDIISAPDPPLNRFDFTGGLLSQETVYASAGDRVCLIDTTVVTAITVTNELGCDFVHSDGADFNPANPTAVVSIDCPGTSPGCSATSFVADFYFIVPYDPPDDPPVGDGAYPPFPFCTFTITVDAGGGMTETVVYTRNTNLVSNPSFEIVNGYRPVSWTLGNAPVDAMCSIGGGVCNAYDGNNLLRTDSNDTAFEAIQDVALWLDGTYMAGFYATAECDEGDESQCQAGELAMAIDGYINGRTYSPNLAGSCTLTGGEYSCPWQPVTGTISAYGGGGLAFLGFDPPGQGQLKLDYPFMYPVDEETGELICEPEYYAPYDPDDDPSDPPDPPDDPPVPGGSGGPAPDSGPVLACYACQKPTGFSLDSVSKWLSYLACILFNIFSCSVRIWFLNVVNMVFGVVRWFTGLAAWLPTNFTNILFWVRDAVQAGFNFIRDGWVNVITWLALSPSQILERIFQTEFVQAIWRQFNFLSALFEVAGLVVQTIITIANNLLQAVIGFAEILIGLANAVRNAFAVEAYEIDFIPGCFGGDGPGGFSPEMLEADGINNEKICWLVVASLATVDQVVGSIGLTYIQFLVIGIMSLILIAWTLQTWHEILPI